MKLKPASFMNTLAPTLLILSGLPAAALTTSHSFTPNLGIPDHSSVGVADFRTISTTVEVIESISVTLTISGGFNGDYYAYLQHGSGFSVLLNRPGTTATDDLGYADSGLTITLTSDPLAHDIHLYQNTVLPGSAALMGTWAADGRAVDPLVAIDTDPRTALLDNFNNLDGNGTWVLFVADRSSGDVGTFTSWTLNLTGHIPEPSALALASMALLGAVRRRR
jgi:subtilisin-like proprotein convertase family protein